MASRIAALTVVDCLFVAVAQRKYKQTMRALERTYAAVQARRLPGWPGRLCDVAGRLAGHFLLGPDPLGKLRWPVGAQERDAAS
jgi:hypothetical protein